MEMTICGARCDERERRKSSKWLQASAEEQTAVVPVGQSLVYSNKKAFMTDKSRLTYRAFKLGSLSSPALNNIVQTDLSIPKMLTLGPARN